MEIFILLGIECSKDCLNLIFQFITAIGVIFTARGIYLNKRSEYLSIMDKCTREFRDIIRREAEMKAKSIVDSRLIRNDYLGLFNEQLFYIEKSYAPKEIALEWISTIYDFVVENKGERFSCQNPNCNKSNIFSCQCDGHQDIECFDRVKNFYDLCIEMGKKERTNKKTSKRLRKRINLHLKMSKFK